MLAFSFLGDQGRRSCLIFLWRAIFHVCRDTAPLALCRSEQFLHSAEVVGGGDELDEPVDAPQAAQIDLAQRAVELGPAEDLLYQLALLLADPEAVTAAFGLGEGVGPFRVGRVLGHVRHDLPGA